MNILVLEDSGYRITTFIELFYKDTIKISETAQGAIDYLNQYVFDIIFLDHDLGDGNGCGADVASYLYKNSHNKNNQSKIIIHSWNVVAANKMMSYLPEAILMPFTNEIVFDLDLDKR